MKWIVFVMLTAFVFGARSDRASAEAETARFAAQSFTVYPIGRITKAQGKTKIVLDKQYQPGLLGLNEFSHVYVYWWFNRNDTPEKRAVLQVHPRGNQANPLTGVFATRSPCRPNLIGMTLCKIISVKGNVVEIDRIDAFDGTPVLDIKPYIPQLDAVPDAIIPEWLKEKPKKCNP